MLIAYIVQMVVTLVVVYKLWMLYGRVDYLAAKLARHLRESHGEELD